MDHEPINELMTAVVGNGDWDVEREEGGEEGLRGRVRFVCRGIGLENVNVG